VDNLRYIVAIVVPTQDDGRRVGTGCSVSDGLVLTARHVVFPKNCEPIIVYFGAVHGNNTPGNCIPVSLEEGCIAWDGGESLDAVFLRCPRPNDWRGSSVSWAPTMESRKWHSRGYPRTVSVEATPLAPAGFDGVLEPTIEEDGFALSTVKVPPPEANGWKGASGMPLFCSNSGGILGLAYEVAQGFEGKKISVVPSWKLFENEQFKALIQKDDEAFQKFRAEMRERLATILFGNQSVALALQKHYGVNKSNTQERAAEIAEKIAKSQPDDFLTHLYQIQYGEPGRSGLTVDAELQTIADIMHVALPILNDPDVRQAVQEASSSMASIVVKLGIATRTVAEIAMAQADGYAASFMRVSSSEPDPPGRFALDPLPVAGRDPDGRQTQQDLIGVMETFLDQRFITGSARGRFSRGEKSKDSIDVRVKHINTRLGVSLKKEGRHYYYAAILPTGEQQRSATLNHLDQLKQSFPSITFLTLDDDPMKYDSETGRYAIVADLCRNSQENNTP